MGIMVLARYVCYANSRVRRVQGQPLFVHRVCKDIHFSTTSVLLNVRLGIFVTRRQVNVTFVLLNVQAVWVHQLIVSVVQLGTNFSYRQCPVSHNVQSTHSHKALSVLHANTHALNAHHKLNASAVSQAV